MHFLIPFHLQMQPMSISWPLGTVYFGFPDGSAGKESACNAGDTGDMGLIPGSGRSPGGGHGNPFQDSCLENPHGQWSLVGQSPQGCKESDTTGTTHTNTEFTQSEFLINMRLRKCLMYVLKSYIFSGNIAYCDVDITFPLIQPKIKLVLLAINAKCSLTLSIQ